MKKRRRGTSYTGIKLPNQKKEGGLGIKISSLQNACFMSKLRWDLHINSPKPWVAFIRTKYNYPSYKRPELMLLSFVRAYLNIWISLTQTFPTPLKMVLTPACGMTPGYLINPFDPC